MAEPASPNNLPNIVALVSVSVAALTVIVNYFLNRMQFRDKMLEAERAEIYKKLNEFYGPFLQLRHASSKLHERFKNGQEFSTLVKLAEGTKFEGNDAVLLEEIITIGKQCQMLIHEKSGLIDDFDLRSKHLPEANRHYFVIQKVIQGKIKGEPERFEADQFPHEIDEILERRFDELQKRLKKINRKSRRLF